MQAQIQNPLAALPNRPMKVNVGGVKFDTNTATLQGAGQGSLLAKLAEEYSLDKRTELFLDRDPDLFRAILSLLHTKRLPPLPAGSDLDLLIVEAAYYGVLEFVKSCLYPPTLDGLDVEKSKALLSNGRDFPSAISVLHSDGSLCLGHGSKVTFYDWALRRCSTTLTELLSIGSLQLLSDSLVAMGSPDMPGLHVYDVLRSKHKKSIMWSGTQDPRVFKPSVYAITTSSKSIFASFSSAKGGDNTIAFVDPERLEVVDDIGRQSGLSATVPGKLQWMEKRGLLVAGSTVAGPFGHTAHLRLFDVRSKEQIWEWKEPNLTLRAQEKDSFADWTISEDIDGIFKIGVASGRMELLDLRLLKEESDPWMIMRESRPDLRKCEGGVSNLLVANGRQVFCSRGGDIEVWSEVPLQLAPDEKFWETSFRRNFLDQRRSVGTGYEIAAMAVGGNRLFVARKELQGLEVWETRGCHKL
ncbi:hypothetical protein KP509_38G034700 [Ceratopteris richardii]|uniref:BTB domain-containing protein n=1 Tax=Ceratopteris richardii TaxID=49495 RepID=A0A8T2Q3Q6_CERRI|nr:hypothetical protein KP509_38G034700 [Ceratopteris richardii]